MEDGKEVDEALKKDGVDEVGKVGEDVEELHGEVRVPQPLDGGGDGGTCEIKVDAKDNAASCDGVNDSEIVDGLNDAVAVGVNGNLEDQLKGAQSDEVLKGPDGKEEVKETELPNAGEEVQKLAAYEGKDGKQKETSDVNEVQESNEHTDLGEFQQLEKPVVQEETGNQDTRIQIDDADNTGLTEHNDTNEYQQLDKPAMQEENDNQDAEIQIDDDDTGMIGHNSSDNMENVPADPTTAAKDVDDQSECLELPVEAKSQAEAVLPEATDGVLGVDFTTTNAIVESDGEKLDVLSQVDFETDVHPENGMGQMEWTLSNERVDEFKENNFESAEKQIQHVKLDNPKANDEKLNSSLYLEGDESGTEEEQISFFREVESFFKSRGTDFRPPKFYGEPLNLLKLWRAVIRLGGYEQVTSCKLWRQIGESFNPPKTCTTVSWTFRLFYEKALLEFEKHKMRDGDLPYDNSYTEFDTETQTVGSHGLGSGRVMRDSAARAMQGWHSQRALSNGEIGDPIIKDKSLSQKKHAKNNDFASHKRKATSPIEHPSKLAWSKSPRLQTEINVIDAGEPANWVKINVRKTKDCFEIYALVPGLMREEVRVQSDPAGRLVISGEPQQLDNPWGITPFKKVVSLPSRIDPHQTSAVVTLHGQLFVRVPFEQLDGQ